MGLKRIYIVLCSIIAIIIVLACIFFTIDYTRVRNDELPIFCIQGEAYLDGGTTVYYGLGYKVIDFHVIVDEFEFKYFDEKKIGSWFMKYDDFEIEEENLE